MTLTSEAVQSFC